MTGAAIWRDEQRVDLTAELIARADFWRRPPSAAAFREWSHFCIFADGVHLLVNFNVTQRPDGVETPRVVALARTRDGLWDGDVEQCQPETTRIPGGQIAADMGRSRFRFRGHAYELRLELGDRPIEARLRLRPCTRPALTTSIPLGTHAMHWFVVPRLEAEGFVEVGGRRVRIDGALAYHDHDWGQFSWGDDYSWEWASILPRDRSCPWTLIFHRISNRARTISLSQGVLVWKGVHHVRTLHEGAVTTTHVGRLSARGALRVPRVMSLVSPGCAADLPRHVEVRAEEGRDVVEIELDLRDAAQVAVPNDTDLSTTIVSECYGEARVGGRVRGENLRLIGSAIVEMNRAGA